MELEQEELDRIFATAEDIAVALHDLGKNRASGGMGAIEALGLETQEGSMRIAEAINNLADAVRSHGDRT